MKTATMLLKSLATKRERGRGVVAKGECRPWRGGHFLRDVSCLSIFGS